MGTEPDSGSHASVKSSSATGYKTRAQKTKRKKPTGKLKIGNHWNAISIIALSQHSPFKALAEFVENSIDAKARHITVLKSKDKRNHFIRIMDDGEGIRHNQDGVPDFKYVATHICDSLKRQLKESGDDSLQGEFGIGLLGFWTLGKSMTISSNDIQGNVWDMHMEKGDAGYHIEQRPVLVSTQGTEITVNHISTSGSSLTGEKINQFLADELSERIRTTGVEITVRDTISKFDQVVKPRDYSGTHLPLPENLSRALPNSLNIDLYFKSHPKNRKVALFKHGTRILEDITSLTSFACPPWNSGYLQGKIDTSDINLAPATRLGAIEDDLLDSLKCDLAHLESYLNDFIYEQELNAREKSTEEIRRVIRRAMKESLIALKAEGIQWETTSKSSVSILTSPLKEEGCVLREEEVIDSMTEDDGQKLFFQMAGALHSAVISPSSTAMQVFSEQEFRAFGRDKQRRALDDVDSITWEVVEGNVSILEITNDKMTLEAPGNPGLARIRATLTHQGISKYSEALITLTNSAPFIEASDDDTKDADLFIPDLKLVEKHGDLWRSRFHPASGIIHINSGHRDYIYASTSKRLLTRYLSKLYCKELILHNSGDKPMAEILEQMVQLETYMEQNLKT